MSINRHTSLLRFALLCSALQILCFLQMQPCLKQDYWHHFSNRLRWWLPFSSNIFQGMSVPTALLWDQSINVSFICTRKPKHCWNSLYYSALELNCNISKVCLYFVAHVLKYLITLCEVNQLWPPLPLAFSHQQSHFIQQVLYKMRAPGGLSRVLG